MVSNDDSTSGVPAANPGPFVVSHPCTVCNGQGNINGQPVPTCRDTGVEGSSTDEADLGQGT